MNKIGFAFDAFSQWSELHRSKMKWRMKVGFEWRPSMAGQPKIDGRPTTFSLLSPPLSPFLAQPPHLWDRMEGLWLHGLATGHPLAPLYKGCQGEPPPSPHKLISNLKFPESFSKFLDCLSKCESLSVKVESRRCSR
jgi:hypothetical protein